MKIFRRKSLRIFSKPFCVRFSFPLKGEPMFLFKNLTLLLFFLFYNFNASAALSQESKRTNLPASFLMAAKKGNLFSLKLLLKLGVNKETQDERGRTALYIASRYGHINLVNFLIRKRVNLEMKTRVAWTALHVASRHGHEPVVRALIDAGANLKAKSKRGWIPEHYALFYKQDKIIQIYKNWPLQKERKKEILRFILRGRSKNLPSGSFLVYFSKLFSKVSTNDPF